MTLVISAANDATVADLAGLPDNAPVRFKVVYITRESSTIPTTAGELRKLIEKDGGADDADALFEIDAIHDYVDSKRASIMDNEDGGLKLDD